MILTFPGVVGDIDLYMKVLRAVCGDTAGKSMVDLCCAFAPNTPKLGFAKRRYFDIIDRKLDHPEEQQFFDQTDVLSITLAPEWIRKVQGVDIYDVAICSDGVEHLTAEDGHKLLNNMQTYSRKQIIFTPLGELWMEKTPTSDPEAHRSAWYPSMLLGWACFVFPDYHKEWKVGAFFAWKCDSIEQDFERVKKELEYFVTDKGYVFQSIPMQETQQIKNIGLTNPQYIFPIGKQE
jgi:hypothetical protein